MVTHQHDHDHHVPQIDIWCNNAGINANHGWRLCLEVSFCHNNDDDDHDHDLDAHDHNYDHDQYPTS